MKYFPSEVTYKYIALADHNNMTEDLRTVLNDVRPEAVAIDEEHMAELVEHAKTSTPAPCVWPDDPPVLLVKLPNEANL